ncbi:MULTISPECIES: hypothetical protein [Corynebacterium]|uniref:hypothetical protein n=1 Tax=Corynebacterium TaxID=1716 RepID=UPI00195CB3E4|nr:MULTISPECIES: hypothetical protein [Corynebacterium]MDN8625052.1 hypothetical protein [Corynebacterium kroppenstedtii]QRQ64810.1 hypothetical protein I6J23_09855 [Corynebacterium kroppenstedtii]
MTVLALLLAVVAFAFLIVALVLASKAWAIACIVVGAIGVLIVIIDIIVKRKERVRKSGQSANRE